PNARHCAGAKHSIVLGAVKRSSNVSSSCRKVVPVRQCPMMKIGGASSAHSRIRFPKMSRWTTFRLELTNEVTNPNKPRATRVGETAKRLRVSKASQAETVMPYQILKAKKG